MAVKYAIGICVALLGPVGALAQPTPAEKAAKLRAEEEALGKKLISILNDSEKPTSERAQAAEALGELRYQPGIPALIKHIKLDDPRSKKVPTGEKRAQADSVCTRALRKYGLEVLGPILKQYVEETDERTLRLLEASLPNTVRNGDSRLDALAYIRGFATQVPVYDYLERVRAIYTLCHPDPKKVTFPPEMLKDK